MSFGCDIGAAGSRPVERWDDVPAVSDGYEAARDRILERLRRLLGEVSHRAAR